MSNPIETEPALLTRRTDCVALDRPQRTAIIRDKTGSFEDVTLIERLLPWQKRGLQQTASGYGARLTTTWVCHYQGRTRRVYCTIYSNIGTCWMVCNGKKIILG